MMKHTVLLCALVFCLVVQLCNAHGHGEDDIRRGKEKWFKQPEGDAHVHDHGHDHHHGHDHGHHHHDHGHVHDHGHDHHHGHDHGHHHGHDHGHVHDHHHDHGHGDHQHVHKHAHAKPTKKPRNFSQTLDVWWRAIFATILISAAPFVILFAVPLESSAEEYQPLLKILLSFASGGLLGDAFLHLIPHAISPHSHDEDGHHHHHHDEHDHSASTAVGMWVMGGVVAFLCIEKVVRLLQGGEGHCHHHTEEKAKKEEEVVEDKSGGEADEKSGETAVKRRKKSNKSEDEDDKAEEKEEKSEEVEEEKPMKVAGYLNLAADFFHNFTDGLAIGASFLGGQKLGWITTFTILFHEVPHEIGDFAILIQSGCGKQKAMWLQLSTATGAMIGCVIGLLTENVGESTTSWILPFTAGGFIYIATVSVIPELLKDTSDLKQTIKEISAMLMGIFMMVIIAVMEH